MAKRTAINIARSTVVVLTILVGILFAGQNAFAETVSATTNQTDNQLFLESIDSFLTGGVNQAEIPSLVMDEQNLVSSDTLFTNFSAESGINTNTSIVVGESDNLTDFETNTFTLASTSEATSSEAIVTTLFEIGSTTNATTTGTTTPAETPMPPILGGELATSTGSTTPILEETGTSTVATSTGILISVSSTTPQIISTSTATSTLPESFGGEVGDNSTTTLMMVSNLELVATSTATSTATTTSTTTQSFRVKYYRYDNMRSDMAGWGIPFDEIQGIDPSDPWSASWTKDWFTDSFLIRTSIEDNIRFGDRFAPFAGSTDPFSDPEAYLVAPNFGAHFMGIASVIEEGDYTITITTDGDTWFYMDRVLRLKNLSGIKPAETLTQTIHMVPGQQYVLNMFFTERIALYPYFDFTFPGVTIIPCDSDACEPEPLDPDTTGPTAPVIVSPIPPVSSPDTDFDIPITWTTSVDLEIVGDITSGLKGYHFVWDQISDTTPTLVDPFTTSTSTVITNLTPGIWWFHVVAIDNAGNTSAPTTHHGPFCIGLASCEDTPPISGPFEIRDLRATDITKTSMIIRFRTVNPDGTEHPASSRVVYDLISHSSNSTVPNYEYIYSTSVSDENPYIVDHTVTISGLTAETVYYLRAVSVDATSTVVSNEINVKTQSNGGGGGGGGGGSKIVSIVTPTPTPIPTPIPTTCQPYLLKYIKLGADNDPKEVLKLQVFLKVVEGRDDIPLTGFYDLKTFNAVKDFQKKYGLDVLGPWGIIDSTGYVFITTSLKINYIYCGIKERITLDLRNFYPKNETQFAQADDWSEEFVFGTSTDAKTSNILPLAMKATTGPSRLNSVQLAFAGFVDLFGPCPWFWLLLLALLIAFIIWINRSKEEKSKGDTTKSKSVDQKKINS